MNTIKEMSRMDELLRNAAQCFYKDLSPFATDELIKQEVSSDEVVDLSHIIGYAIEFYLNHKKQAVDEIIDRLVEKELGKETAKQFHQYRKFQDDLKKVLEK